MFLAKVKQQGKELVMSTNKDCRNAKTAEEYLLQCLFKAEDDRDKAKTLKLNLRVNFNFRL